MSLKSGHRVSHVTGKELEEMSEGFRCRKDGLIRLDPGGWIYYPTFLDFADRIYELKLRPDDVIVLTYPKSGTTWMQEIVWTLKNNLDFIHPEAKEAMIVRSINMEMGEVLNLPTFSELSFPPSTFKKFEELCPNGNPEDPIDFQVLDNSPDPRHIKSHKPLSLLPPDMLETSKVIYVARNPMDVCISCCHFYRLIKGHGYSGSFDRFLGLFLEDKLNWSPYWTHIEEAWRNRNHPNLLFCFYEDMKRNPRENIVRVAEFLGIQLDEDKIEKVDDYTSFESMKKRNVYFGVPSDQNPFLDRKVCQEGGGFFRKGESESWRSELTGDQVERIKQWSLQRLKDFEESETFLSKWFPETEGVKST